MNTMAEALSSQDGAQFPARPLTILIAALGGEGGGVLADWLVAAATAQGFPVQSTSIPGVAQRTGATTYYVEIYPVHAELLAGKRPVLALTPSPGFIDVMAASEFVEAGRAMQNGFTSPDRTILIASTHRVYSIAEKSAAGDGRFDEDKLYQATRELTRRAVLFDMAELARKSGTIINAVLLGAMAGTGALPLTREACEAAIRKHGKGAEASLRGFAAGYANASGHVTPTLAASFANAAAALPPEGEHPRLGPAALTRKEARAEQKRWPGNPAPQAGSLTQRVRNTFPPECQRIIAEGVSRLTDYQDTAYALHYLDRLEQVLRADRAGGGGPGGYRLTNETGRYLALWMSYEDLIRVADLKTRRARLTRVRAEVGAKPGEPIVLVEFLKPGLDELCSVLPRALARRVLTWAKGRRFNIGLHVKTTTVTGYLLMRSLAWLKPWRRGTYRYHEEHRLIERWLSAISSAAAKDLDLALEIAECQRLVKGYGDTHKRGIGNFLSIFETLAEGRPELRPSERAQQIRSARLAALAEHEGPSLPKDNVKPIVWLTEKRAAMLNDK